MAFRFDLITLFPDLVRDVMAYGVVGRAVETGIVQVNSWNPRDYALGRHRNVDDSSYGGGPGMVMKAEPVDRALDAAFAAGATGSVVYLSPQGRKVDHGLIECAAGQPGLVLLAGRYEGVDERVLEARVDQEWSIGDFVVSGGELPALLIVDAVTRLLPGALGDQQSAEQDSFSAGLLDYPHYTRPELYAGRAVPEVLTSGDHSRIARWRAKQALGRTWLRRSDLLRDVELSAEQKQLLAEFIDEYETSGRHC